MIVEEEPQVEVTAVEIAVPQEEEAAVTVETVETEEEVDPSEEDNYS